MAIQLGVIGFGGRCRDLIRHIPGLGTDVVLKAICDPAELAQTEAKKMNGQVVIYPDHKTLCKDPAIDWVFVGSWNCLHRDHAVAALNAGKHVFCEKPLALSTTECNDINAAVKKSGKRFVMGFVLRYSPHYIKIKELIDQGKIGSIISMEFNETLGFCHGGFIHADWRRQTKTAGTHLLEKCCHDVDLVNWIVGSRVVRAASFGGCNFFIPENIHHIARIGKYKDGKDAYCTWPGPDKNPFTAEKDIVDNQVAIMEFANSVRTTFHTNCNAGIPERRMYILGTEGAIRADVISGDISLARIGFDEKIQSVPSGVSGGHGGADELLVEQWTDAMLHDKPMPTGIEDGIASAVTCFGVDQALTSGSVVDLRPLWKKVGIDV